MAGVFVGTSGWIYKGWAGTFYHRTRERAATGVYATRFNSVESTPRFTPCRSHPRQKLVSARFVLAVKGSRFITLMKKLNVERKSIQVFFDRLKPLKEKCGPILWQLPPRAQ